MSYKFVIHTNECIGRFEPRYEEAQRFIDSEVLRDSAPYVPMRSGILMGSGDTGTVIGSGKVKYIAPYSKRCYYGGHMHFSKDKHPQASAQWFEKAKAVKKEAWRRGVQQIIKGG